MRIIGANTAAVRVRTGSSSATKVSAQLDESVTRDMAGSQRSSMEKARTSSVAIRNSGAEVRAMEPVVSDRSGTPPGRIAAKRPSPTARGTASSAASPPRSRVLGSRGAMISDTGMPLTLIKRIRYPRWPVCPSSTRCGFIC